jgi:hypothetical protein
MDLYKIGGDGWKNHSHFQSQDKDHTVLFFGDVKKRIPSQAQFFKKDARKINQSNDVENMLTTIRTKERRQFIGDLKR